MMHLEVKGGGGKNPCDCAVFPSSPCFSINIVKWSSQGMLRLTQEAMNELFQPTITNIIKHIGRRKRLRFDEGEGIAGFYFLW